MPLCVNFWALLRLKHTHTHTNGTTRQSHLTGQYHRWYDWFVLFTRPRHAHHASSCGRMYHITLAAPGHFTTQHALLSGWRTRGIEVDGKGGWSTRFGRMRDVQWIISVVFFSPDLHPVTALRPQKPWAETFFCFSECRRSASAGRTTSERACVAFWENFHYFLRQCLHGVEHLLKICLASGSMFFIALKKEDPLVYVV